VPDSPHDALAAYGDLLRQQVVETEQLAAALLDLACRPDAAATVAAILGRHDALAVLRLNLALTRQLARAVHDAAREADPG
jgi:hypothetical protein